MKMDKDDAFADARPAADEPADAAAQVRRGDDRHPLMGHVRRLPRIDWRRHMRLLLLVVVPLVVVAAAGAMWLRGGRHVTTDNAYVKADIVQLASEIPGRLLEVKVRDHSQVQAGDVILRLDPAPYQLALDKAEAEVDSARSVINQAKASIQEAHAEMKEYSGRYDYFIAQAKRQRDLATRGVSPTVKLEQAGLSKSQPK